MREASGPHHYVLRGAVGPRQPPPSPSSPSFVSALRLTHQDLAVGVDVVAAKRPNKLQSALIRCERGTLSVLIIAFFISTPPSFSHTRGLHTHTYDEDRGTPTVAYSLIG